MLLCLCGVWWSNLRIKNSFILLTVFYSFCNLYNGYGSSLNWKFTFPSLFGYNTDRLQMVTGLLNFIYEGVHHSLHSLQTVMWNPTRKFKRGQRGWSVRCEFFKKKYHVFWASNNQTRYWNWFFDFWRLCLRSPTLEVWCDEDVTIHYNNASFWSVNAQMFETKYSINKYAHIHKKPIFLCTYEIFSCIYSVRGEIDQVLTNTSRYTTYCAADVYIFVYIFIRTTIVDLPLNAVQDKEIVWYSGDCF